MSEKLLPPRSGSWTRAVAYTFDTNRRISYATTSIKQIGVSLFPTDWLPWLIYEYGLEDVVPYVRDYQKTLVEGRIWQKRRGTPSGIEIGIGWVESEGRVAPPDGRHNWWEFQIAFTVPPQDLAQIRQLDGIIRLSKASEDELFRMFSPEYDHRPVRMDEHRFDDGGWMDDYSGAPRWDGGPYISFGRDGTSVFDIQPIIGTGAVFEGWAEVDRLGDGMRYDEARFETRPDAFCGSSGETDRTVSAGLTQDTWPEVWPNTSWAEATGSMAFSGPYRRNDGTAAAAYTEDTWPDVHPANGSWQDAAGGQAFSNASEYP